MGSRDLTGVADGPQAYATVPAVLVNGPDILWLPANEPPYRSRDAARARTRRVVSWTREHHGRVDGSAAGARWSPLSRVRIRAADVLGAGCAVAVSVVAGGTHEIPYCLPDDRRRFRGAGDSAGARGRRAASVSAGQAGRSCDHGDLRDGGHGARAGSDRRARAARALCVGLWRPGSDA